MLRGRSFSRGGAKSKRVDEKLIKRVLACLFVLLYVPYLYQQGYQRAFQSPGDFPTLYWGAKMSSRERTGASSRTSTRRRACSSSTPFRP
jgi:hypothetical protein